MTRKLFLVNITDKMDREAFEFDALQLGDMMEEPQKSEFFDLLDTHHVVGLILDDGKPEPASEPPRKGNITELLDDKLLVEKNSAGDSPTEPVSETPPSAESPMSSEELHRKRRQLLAKAGLVTLRPEEVE